MKILLFVLSACLLSGSAFAQRHKLATVNADPPDGKLLQQSLQENDPSKKLELMSQYISQFADKQEATGWVLSQMQPAYQKTGNYDKAIETGEKLLAIDPDDIDASYGNLKAAKARKMPPGS